MYIYIYIYVYIYIYAYHIHTFSILHMPPLFHVIPDVTRPRSPGPQVTLSGRVLCNLRSLSEENLREGDALTATVRQAPGTGWKGHQLCGGFSKNGGTPKGCWMVYRMEKKHFFFWMKSIFGEYVCGHFSLYGETISNLRVLGHQLTYQEQNHQKYILVVNIGHHYCPPSSSSSLINSDMLVGSALK